jgi:hypothetical protein
MGWGDAATREADLRRAATRCIDSFLGFEGMVEERGPKRDEVRHEALSILIDVAREKYEEMDKEREGSDGQ